MRVAVGLVEQWDRDAFSCAVKQLAVKDNSKDDTMVRVLGW